MLALVAVILTCIPTSFHSGTEVFAITVSGVLTAAWLLVAAFVLLRDHAAAWVFFGAFASGVPAALRLLGEPASADRIAGVSALVLLAVALAALLGGTTRRPAVEPSAPAAPEPLPFEVP
jgi:predicted cation transporter